MIRKIVTTQEAKLREKTKPVTKVDKKLLQTIRDLEETLKVQKDPEGVGIAAPQIGVPLKMFLINHKGNRLVICNPEIIKLSKRTNDPKSLSRAKSRYSGQAQKKQNEEAEYVMEGCLSLPHYYGPVERAWEIELKYDAPEMVNGKWLMVNRQEKFIGFLAQIIQHETDHLSGKLFIDRLFEQNRQLFQLKNNKWTEVDLP